ncbi:MAG: hypothetical protein LBN05_00315 [Oscillospiraceae bacterium]|jgi:electron transport complex protein RnfA|nr:hypothetical protein [Oscillospiraceae bacterium]
MHTVVKLIFIALYTIFVQNLVFSGGFGMGEAMRIAIKPKRVLMFAGLLTGFSVLDSVACAALFMLPALDDIGLPLQMILSTLVLLALFLLAVLIVTLATHRRPMEKFLSTLGMAALNTLVFTLPVLGRLSAYGIWEAFAFGLGAGLAFVLALGVLRQGVVRIMDHYSAIPHAFRGTPALFVYSALFSLSMVGLAGETIFA